MTTCPPVYLSPRGDFAKNGSHWNYLLSCPIPGCGNAHQMKTCTNHKEVYLVSAAVDNCLICVHRTWISLNQLLSKGTKFSNQLSGFYQWEPEVWKVIQVSYQPEPEIRLSTKFWFFILFRYFHKSDPLKVITKLAQYLTVVNITADSIEYS